MSLSLWKVGFIYKNKQTAAQIGLTHQEDRASSISSACQIKYGISKRYAEEELMEASITAFCSELSNLGVTWKRKLSSICQKWCIFWGLTCIIFLIMNFTGSYQEQNKSPKNHLRKVLNGNSKCNLCQYILASCVFLSFYELCFVWCCWDYKNIVLIHRWKIILATFVLTHLKDTKQNNNRRWRTKWRQESGVCWNHRVLKSSATEIAGVFLKEKSISKCNFFYVRDKWTKGHSWWD